MAFDVSEIERFAGLLAANAKFKLDYNNYISNKRKLLIVEGKTDHKFIKSIQNDCVDCLVAAEVFKSNNQFRTKSSEAINCKNAIVKIITGISHYPSPFVKYPDDLDKWDLYGLVDSDFEEFGSVRPTPRLFVTDTHDLETLLLSTDNDLLFRLKGCKIHHDDIARSYCLAYQLAIIRDELYKKNIDIKAINCGSRQVDFSAFIEDGGVSKSKINENTKTFCAHKNIKKRIDTQGCWKQDKNDFSTSFPSRFWNVVNGHDILQLLMYCNKSAKSAYGDSDGYSLYRSFEFELIAVYDYSQFSKTELCEKMNQAKLINTYYVGN